MQKLPLVIFILLVASCRSRPGEEVGVDNVGFEVRQTLERYHMAIRQEGLLAEFKFLDSSQDFFWVPPGYKCAISYDSVSRILRENATLFSKVDNSFDTLMVRPLTAGMAMYTGRLTSVCTDKTGKTFSVKLVETGLVVKRSGQWKLLSGQTAILPE